jgi:hypothetical protein
MANKSMLQNKYIGSPAEQIYMDIFQITDSLRLPLDLDETIPYIMQNVLDEREHDIITRYYYKHEVLQDIANDYQMTRERIRQIRNKALSNMGTPYCKQFFLYGQEYIEQVKIIRSKNVQKEKQSAYNSLQVTYERLKQESSSETYQALLKLKRDINIELAKYEATDDLLNTPIVDYPLSERAYNSLHHYGVYTIKDICNLTDAELRNIPHVGVKVHDEIIKLIENLNLELSK